MKGEEEKKSRRGPIDQRESNIPLDKVEVEDYLELLASNAESLELE